MAALRAAESLVDTSDEYRKLLLTNDCTPEQQAGSNAGECPTCATKTVNQHTRQCIVCGWKKPEGEAK